MAPKFGTSGLRGLVTELTPGLVAEYIRTFIAACPMGSGLWVGHDLRPSSPGLAALVLEAARGMGLCTVDCGATPTPALALAAMREGAAAVMVTGSHIPADRNGLKFYTPQGEISKVDEEAILAAFGTPLRTPGPATRRVSTAGANWVARYVTGFGPHALAGLRLGVWAHSAVSRDLLVEAMVGLGAECISIGRSETFIPLDTEAVPPTARANLAEWATTLRLDAILSTDGDGDRPLLADAAGQVISGDLLGQITAAALGADSVVTPVSSNTGAELSGRFARVLRTKIGSPFVIAGMAALGGRVVGYEANGGFLLGFDAVGPVGPLPSLATRDSLLPLVAALALSRAAGGLAALVAQQPPRFTAADRLEQVASARAQTLIAQLGTDPARLATFLTALHESPASTNRVDGLRLILETGRILHLRPSGNAPELRLYIEAEGPDIAIDLLERGLALLRSHLGDTPN